MKLIAAAAVLALLISGCGYIYTMAEMPNTYTIVVDAGHGGMDGGASAANGTKESDINLQIAKRLESLLAFCGNDAIMTRSEDTHLGGNQFKKAADIKARLQTADDHDADVFVSIHQNYYPDSRYGGAQVFFGSASESSLLAQAIQNNMITALDPNNSRTIKDGTETSYLMKNAECTSVLVECGFLSNAKDAENLTNDDYQKLTAMALAAGLMEFRGEGSNES